MLPHIWRQRPSTLAGSVSRGAACTYNGGAVGPALAVTLPILGARMTFAATSGPAGGAGIVYVSGVPPAPIPISPACFLQLDPTSMVGVGGFAFGAGGSGALALDLPASPALVGGRLASQVAALAGLTLQLSNGQELTLGY